MTPCVRIRWRLRQNKVDFCLGQHIATWSLFVRNERSLRGVLPNQLVEIWLEDDKAGLVEHNSVKLCLLPSLLRNLAKLWRVCRLPRQGLYLNFHSKLPTASRPLISDSKHHPTGTSSLLDATILNRLFWNAEQGFVFDCEADSEDLIRWNMCFLP